MFQCSSTSTLGGASSSSVATCSSAAELRTPVGALAGALEGGRHLRRVGQLRQARRRAQSRASARGTARCLLVERLEQVGVRRLGDADQQKAVVAQAVAEHVLQLLLQLAVEIDQHVAARDQVQLRERRVAQHAVRGEHDACRGSRSLRGSGRPRRGNSARAAPPTRRPRSPADRCPRAPSRARSGRRRSAKITSSRAASRRLSSSRNKIASVVGFLARRAAGHPDADRLVVGSALDERDDDLRAQRFPRPRDRGRTSSRRSTGRRTTPGSPAGSRAAARDSARSVSR